MLHQSKLFQKMVMSVAAAAHADWQKTYRTENPNAKDRWKPVATEDQDWFWQNLETETGFGRTLRVSNTTGEQVCEIDILNRSYENLSPGWQTENRLGAEVACSLVLDAVLDLENIEDVDFVETASARVHTEWLKRNGKWASLELQAPYAELSEANKEKDRVFVRRAVEAYLLSIDTLCDKLGY